MKLLDSFRRWSLMTFLPSSPDKKQDRLLAQLWRSLKKDKPLWYDPVPDRLTKEFAQALQNLKAAVDGLSALTGLTPGQSPPPSLVPSLVSRLADAFLAKANLNRELLSFAHIHAEVSAQKGSDYRGMQHLLQTRMQSLPKGEGALWEKALPSVEGLVHLSCFDWTPLKGLVALTTGKAKLAQGAFYVDALEDLAFVLEPITIDAALETLVGHLQDAPATQLVSNLGAARAPLLADGQLLNVIRALRGNPNHPFRRTVYEPPTLSSVFRELIADFDAELRNHRNETERLRLVARMKEVFGDRELVEIPSYNQAIATQLVERKLPDLTYIGAVSVLCNFHEAFHASLLQPLFLALQMQLDFLSPDGKGEFQSHVDSFFSLTERTNKFLEDLRSPTFSKMAPVLAALQAPFLDQRIKQALKKPIEETNKWADDLAQYANREYKDLYLMLEKYVIDLDDSHPKIFSGGSVLISKHPQLVADLKAATKLLKALTGLLRQLVVDPQEPS